MQRSFVELPLFTRAWRDARLTDESLQDLQNRIMADPEVGNVMRGAGGVRKVRLAGHGGGRSGGY